MNVYRYISLPSNASRLGQLFNGKQSAARMQCDFYSHSPPLNEYVLGGILSRLLSCRVRATLVMSISSHRVTILTSTYRLLRLFGNEWILTQAQK